MAADPRDVAEDYLEKHKICQLFETIIAQLLFHKPENPKQYVVKLLESVKASQGTTPALLEEKDFRTMFGMLDITKRGAVSQEQACNALGSVMGKAASFEAAGVVLKPFLSEDDFVSAMQQVYNQGCQQPFPYDYSSKGLLPRHGATTSS